QGHAQHRAERQPVGEADVLDGADHAHRGVGVHDLDVVGGDHDVGVGDEVEAAAGDQPVEGADHRLPDAVGQRRPGDGLAGQAVPRGGTAGVGDLGDVGAGAEVAL